jgi:hypothetical protein
MIFSKKAGGNISPCRFVKQSTTADNTVLQAGAGETVYGISQAGVRRTPYSSLDDGYAAIAGEDLEVFGVGEVCNLELGGTVTRGDRVKSDANGKGVTSATNGDEYGAIALVSGVSGDLIQVELKPTSMRGA